MFIKPSSGLTARRCRVHIGELSRGAIRTPLITTSAGCLARDLGKTKIIEICGKQMLEGLHLLNSLALNTSVVELLA
jgi:hypothetical protein